MNLCAAFTFLSNCTFHPFCYIRLPTNNCLFSLTVRLLKRVCVYRLESADRRLAVHKKSLGPEGGLIANDSGTSFIQPHSICD